MLRLSTICSLTCYDSAIMNSLERNEFGDWLQRELSDRRLSYARFARMAELSDTSIKLWITGERKISERSCDVVADALGVSRNFVRELAKRPSTDNDPIVERAEHAALPEFPGFEQLTIDERHLVQAYIDGLLQRRSHDG